MKLKVVELFRDKYTGAYYYPGDVIYIKEETRVQDMESKGLVERISVEPIISSDKCLRIV